MISLSVFDNSSPAYVVGLAHGSPPRYARFRETPPSGWTWTGELTEAEFFWTKEQAEAHLKGDMAELVDGNGDVKVLKVELKVSEAT